MKRAAIVAAVLCIVSGARAEPPPNDPAAAEAAFAEARALMQQGRYAEACPKLEASHALDPAVGTLLNLGDCYEKTGRTASAWLRYRDAAAMAVQVNQREREAIARERASALEPKLCKLTVRAVDRPGLEVRRDGAPIARAAIGLPVPVDPGTHAIEAEAPGASTFSTTVEIKAPAGRGPCALTVVDVPALEERGASAPAPVPMKPIDLAPAPPPPPPPSPWHTTHTLAVVSAAGGLVGIGVGAAFGLSAVSTKSDADAQCTSAGCTALGKSLLADAGSSADVATIGFVAGGVLLATGAVLWITSPSLRATSMLGRDLRAGIRF